MAENQTSYYIVWKNWSNFYIRVFSNKKNNYFCSKTFFVFSAIEPAGIPRKVALVTAEIAMIAIGFPIAPLVAICNAPPAAAPTAAENANPPKAALFSDFDKQTKSLIKFML